MRAGAFAGLAGAFGVTYAPAAARWLRVGAGLAGGATAPLDLDAGLAPWFGVQLTGGGQWRLGGAWSVGVTASVTAPLVAPRWLGAPRGGGDRDLAATPWVGAGVDLRLARAL